MVRSFLVKMSQNVAVKLAKNAEIVEKRLAELRSKVSTYKKALPKKIVRYLYVYVPIMPTYTYWNIFHAIHLSSGRRSYQGEDRK